MFLIHPSAHSFIYSNNLPNNNNLTSPTRHKSPTAKMQFKTLLSIYVAIVGAVAADTDDPLSQLPTCAKAKLTTAFEATGCTSQTG